MNEHSTKQSIGKKDIPSTLHPGVPCKIYDSSTSNQDKFRQFGVDRQNIDQSQNAVTSSFSDTPLKDNGTCNTSFIFFKFKLQNKFVIFQGTTLHKELIQQLLLQLWFASQHWHCLPVIQKPRILICGLLFTYHLIRRWFLLILQVWYIKILSETIKITRFVLQVL